MRNRQTRYEYKITLKPCEDSLPSSYGIEDKIYTVTVVVSETRAILYIKDSSKENSRDTPMLVITRDKEYNSEVISVVSRQKGRFSADNLMFSNLLLRFLRMNKTYV